VKALVGLPCLTAITLVAAHLVQAPAARAQPRSQIDEADPAGSETPLIGPPAAGGLTADEVARRAASTSHELRARTEETAAARAALDQARSKLLPRLSGLARYTRQSSIAQTSLGNVVVVGPETAPGPLPPGTQLAAVPLSFPVIQNQYTLQASLELPLSDYLLRLPRLHDAARDNVRAALLLEQATRLRLATDARVTFYGWARARLQAEVAARSLAQAQAHLEDVVAAQAVGTASKADLLRVESQVASAELQLTRARSSVATAEQRLRTAMHDAGGAKYAIGEDLGGAPATSALIARRRPEQELVRQALEARLESRALAASVAAARSDAGATRAGGLPRLSAVANALYARPNSRVFPQKDEFTSSWDASLQLSWSPTDMFGTEAGHSAGMARARQLEAERADLDDSITLEVTQSLQALREAEAAIITTRRGLVAAEESYRVRRVMFRNGRATSVELTDAETERSRAQLEVIGALIDRRIAEARLIHAVGQDTGSLR
jgi:outer membrane protein